MLSFELEGKKVLINIETGTESKPHVTLRRECDTELEAELLYRLLDKRLDGTIE